LGISWNIYTHSTETASDSDQIGAVTGWEKKVLGMALEITLKSLNWANTFFRLRDRVGKCWIALVVPGNHSNMLYIMSSCLKLSKCLWLLHVVASKLMLRPSKNAFLFELLDNSLLFY